MLAAARLGAQGIGVALGGVFVEDEVDVPTHRDQPRRHLRGTTHASGLAKAREGSGREALVSFISSRSTDTDEHCAFMECHETEPITTCHSLFHAPTQSPLEAPSFQLAQHRPGLTSRLNIALRSSMMTWSRRLGSTLINGRSANSIPIAAPGLRTVQPIPHPRPCHRSAHPGQTPSAASAHGGSGNAAVADGDAFASTAPRYHNEGRRYKIQRSQCTGGDRFTQTHPMSS